MDTPREGAEDKLSAAEEARRIAQRIDASERLINAYTQAGHKNDARYLRDEIKSLREDLALAESLLDETP